MPDGLAEKKKRWREKYYPVPASRRMNAMEAMDHSIRKWEGCEKSALVQIGLKQPPIEIGGHNCALCCFDERKAEVLHPCSACPITGLSRHTCFREFGSYRLRGAVQPMLRLLRRVRKLMLKDPDWNGGPKGTL